MLTDERGKLLDYCMNYKVICPITLEIQVWANLADLKQTCQIIYDLYLSYEPQCKNHSSGSPTTSDINWSVQRQEKASSLKFWI